MFRPNRWYSSGSKQKYFFVIKYQFKNYNNFNFSFDDQTYF